MFKLKNDKHNSNRHKENKNSKSLNKEIPSDHNKNSTKHFKKENSENENHKEEFKSSSVLRDAIKFSFFHKSENQYENANKIDNVTKLPTSNKISQPVNNFSNYPEDMMNLHFQINDANSERKTLSNFQQEGVSKSENNLNIQTNSNFLMKSEIIPTGFNLNQINHLPLSTKPNLEERFSSTHSTSILNNTYPSLITPLRNQVNSGASSNNNKQAINLEDLFIQEKKIWNILEDIRLNSNINFSCDEYYEFQNMTSLQNLECFFPKTELKNQVKISASLETYSIICLSLLILKNKFDVGSLPHSKNLMYYVHLNFLHIIKIIINKLPKEFKDNMWVIKLHRVLESRNIDYSDDDYNFINQNNNFIVSILKKLIYTYFKSKEDSDLFSILEDVLNNISKYSLNTVKNIMFNIRQTLIQFKIMNQSTMKFAQMPQPYLPPLLEVVRSATYTLVLDLDESLIHFVNNAGNGELLIRPGAVSFIEEMSKYYEVIVFTAAMQDYADSILDTLDPKKTHIKHRLYRYHASMNKNTYVKDISKLGRNLAKTIIIDNVWENFQLQSENGIFIKTWMGDEKDRSLPDLIPLLKDFVIKKVPDVRRALRKFRDTLFRLFIEGDTHPYETVRKFLDSSE